MFKEGARQYQGFHNYKRRGIRDKILVSLALAAVCVGFAVLIINTRRSAMAHADLARLWNEGKYQEVYDESQKQLEEKPLDVFPLSMRGYAAYQIAIAQINSQDEQNYIDECILTLRKALLSKGSDGNGALRYVLGKAYFAKGPAYANLAITYLEEAAALSYYADDIPEYLGISYARTGDYRKSVAAFSEALVPVQDGDEDEDSAPSDILLLAIARSYMEMNEYDSARAYLVRCVETSKDFSVIASARLLLGKALMNMGDIDGAEREYLGILEEGGEQADVHYELGALYAERGETTRARAEWRKALRLDPAYSQAIARLSM
ncbi:MAG: tetratricopeptide repeat protein [Spirochaetaceae bacterium]|jgi:tetratricopeptide (TPR) repeat protein|nr:tetratricopeptide repeat protein [Spirochaetaceae bacterium]